jgi:hypothetical protein
VGMDPQIDQAIMDLDKAQHKVHHHTLSRSSSQPLLLIGSYIVKLYVAITFLLHIMFPRLVI